MKKFYTNLLAIAATLGLTKAFAEKTLSSDQQADIKAAYDKEYGEGSFDKGFEELRSEIEKTSLEDVFKTIGEAIGKENISSAQDIVAAVNDLKDTIAKLGNKAQADQPEANVTRKVVIDGVHTKDFAFGIPNPVFAASKRHNRIAINGALPKENPTAEDEAALKADFATFTRDLAGRYAELAKNGGLAVIRKNGVTFPTLSSIEDWNGRVYQVRRDMLIARIIALPSLRDIFPTVSNVQAGQIFTSLLATAVSQAYQTGRIFKGGVSFEPEAAIVDKVMSKIQFEDLSALELSYLNYLNTNGSDPVKWSLIEWIVLELATQINSERNERGVMGCRVEPTANVVGHELNAATGIFYRLWRYYYKDHKVLPFTDSDLQSYTKSTIGDVFEAFIEECAKHYKDWKSLILYANEAHKPMFTAWLNTKYGQNTGFIPAADTVPNYGNKIVWVPNMTSDIYFLWATIANNMFLLENKPGEELDTQFQRDLEEVLAFSYWKEGVGAGFAGKAYASAALLAAANYKTQVIFMNLPTKSTLAADATKGDAADGRYFVTVAGTNASAAITDIDNAEDGVVYHIEVGGASNLSKIAKSGKFSTISAAWEPTAAGEWIDVVYDSVTGKFYESARG